MLPRLLIVDDEPTFREHLSKLFARKGYHIQVASTAAEATELLQTQRFEVVLLDIVLPDMDGVQLLEQIRERYPQTQVIMMTGNATVENAIASMKLGAYDYLIKPFDFEELSILVERACELSRLQQDSEFLHRELDRQRRFETIVGRSRHIQQVKELIEKVAPTNSTVLITGETGTGKELVARAIHHLSPRKNKPFVVINCSAIQDTLLESELFGHEKGAFTGAIKAKRGIVDVADTGTLFLDEIGDVSEGFQAKLLRFLESGEYRPVGSTRARTSDVRVIAATNRDLKKLLQEGKFREDLYFRLNVFNIHLLPLREKKEDIPELVEYSLKKICARMGKCVRDVSPEALRLLQEYNWPGNVRELENVMERAVILCTGDRIEVEHLPVDIRMEQPRSAIGQNDRSLQVVEREHILRVLEETNWNKTRAAEILGITKKTLYARLHEYGLLRDE